MSKLSTIRPEKNQASVIDRCQNVAKVDGSSRSIYYRSVFKLAFCRSLIVFSLANMTFRQGLFLARQGELPRLGDFGAGQRAW